MGQPLVDERFVAEFFCSPSFCAFLQNYACLSKARVHLVLSKCRSRKPDRSGNFSAAECSKFSMVLFFINMNVMFSISIWKSYFHPFFIEGSFKCLGLLRPKWGNSENSGFHPMSFHSNLQITYSRFLAQLKILIARPHRLRVTNITIGHIISSIDLIDHLEIYLALP